MKRRSWQLIVVGIIVAVAAGVAWFILRSHNQNLTGEAKTKYVMARISRHFLLPSNEIPALATVTDPSKVTSQFLRQAKAGDEVLIYQTNQVAIIYRPSIDRVIAEGPVSIDTPPSAINQSGK